MVRHARARDWTAWTVLVPGLEYLSVGLLLLGWAVVVPPLVLLRRWSWWRWLVGLLVWLGQGWVSRTWTALMALSAPLALSMLELLER
jgi:hypothetical protein